MGLCSSCTAARDASDPGAAAAGDAAAAAATAKKGRGIVPCGKRTDFGYDKDFEARYSLGKLLGHGQFGYTFAAVDRASSERVAVKRIDKNKMVLPVAVEDVKREVKILKALQGHENVVHFYNAFEDDNYVYIVMELCEGGELLDRILAKKDSRYSEKDAAVIVRQMLKVAAECHLHGLVHRDMKPENFLFKSTKEDSPLKATDFGLSDFIRPGRQFRDIVGSAYYVAPEVLKRKSGPESDVWSIGVITYILLCGRRPFWDKTEDGIFKEVLKNKPDFRRKPWPNITSSAKDFVQKLLVKDPRARLTAAQALSHDWVREGGKASEIPLDISVLHNMRQFVKYSRFKQFALRALASTLDSEELSDLRDQFNAIDVDKNGTISLEELKQALAKDVPWRLKGPRVLEIIEAVLENVIKYKWNALPVEQRDGMKNYVSDVIVQLSSNEVSFRQERLYVNKLNIILVQVLKHEWPARWTTFIPDLIAAARSSETICENCMAILKLLSEEIFDFSRGEMTQQKIKELKGSLNSEFRLIHELCLYVLSVSQRPELVRATLATLHAFLSWIPIGFIFESPLLETLLKFFPIADYRNLTLQCLTEVAALHFGDFYDMQYVKMYAVFMSQLQAILPCGTISDGYANGSNEEQAFIQNLALLLTSFFKNHMRILETTHENRTALLLGLDYLIEISFVDDTEMFKVCLDYWNLFVLELFETYNQVERLMELQTQRIPGTDDGTLIAVQQRRQLYAGSLSKLRTLMICRMAKPEEVLIVEDENGNIVRETLKDNDVLVQYKIMRETLIYLSHLDHEDTEQQMLRKLSKQLNGEDWSWNNLNTLCWAIGSISGSMVEEQENRFLVLVIRDLLNLCEITKGKDNKAVIASNIMYVVGQYPRFLRAHWKFLKTVVNKLFEFMHEMHPGVQDMACDTFLKIVQKCKRKFVTLQVGESEPFVSVLLSNLPTTIADLEPHQIHTFYESVSQMIQSESDNTKREEYLRRLMSLPNQKWAEIIGEAGRSTDILKNQDVIRSVLNILQTNTGVACSLGPYFFPQISVIFLDMLTVYRMYSELVSNTISEGGPFASKTSFVKLLRSVKRETLKLIETFLDKAEDLPHLGKQFVPPMMDPVLGDYARNVPDARESEVLSLFATIINKYKGEMLEEVPRIFEAVFQCTLEMITKNFEDYPEHRLKFFSLLRAIGTHCFQAFIQLSSQQLKLVMDSISWAFRHTERNIAETGLSLLLEILKNFEASGFQNQFYKTYFLNIEQEIFAVITDTFHKPGFKLHVSVLQHLFYVVDGLTEPLWDASAVPSQFTNNAMFVRDYTIKLLSSSFPNMTPVEVAKFVDGLFSSKTDPPNFKNHIRDFLVQSKEFSAQDNKDLYAEEAAAQREKERQHMLSIPGLIAPNELQDEMVDS